MPYGVIRTLRWIVRLLTTADATRWWRSSEEPVRQMTQTLEGRTAAALPGCRRSTEGWEDPSAGFYGSIRNCLTSALPYRAASSSFRAFASSGVMLPHGETL